jgi:hypothetical protein
VSITGSPASYCGDVCLPRACEQRILHAPNRKPLNCVNHYATVIAELCEQGKTRTVSMFPNWESAGAYLCPGATSV